MLPKTHRITPPQFRRNITRYSHHENTAVQIIAKGNNLHLVRVGIVVPKRLDKRAVYRNRTKRKISEVIHKKVMGESVGVDLLIKAKKIFSPDTTDTFAQLVTEIVEKAIFTRDQTKPKFT